MRRLLFVDDEPAVLFALQRNLRGQRGDWDCRFSSDTAAALETIEEFGPDVVISDMRMPGMDGADFLGEVAARRPASVRVILSGDLADDTLGRLARVAHVYLGKPCRVDILVAALRRALEARPASDPANDAPLAVAEVPVVSADALYGVLELLARPSHADSDAAVIAALEQAPGLGLKVLQVATWTRWGLGPPPRQVREAFHYLGPRLIREVLSSGGGVHADPGPTSARLALLWRRCAQVAPRASALAIEAGLSTDDAHGAAFIAGLVAAAPLLTSRRNDDPTASDGSPAHSAPLDASMPAQLPDPADLATLVAALHVLGISSALVEAVAEAGRPVEGASSGQAASVDAARQALLAAPALVH